ncbi:alpha/beta hydrolase family protein [Pedococcus sp. 5OH_020]|uniref:alpha/beta hydrolase family protein n=1 Tax=Pedococcus sp. 5OH_020 TaxID=2989814 RepID=UPI0022E9C0B9|nr:alpha/beta fold hydrolase [Pedococcus sp. 5OH_020]
MGDQRTWVRRAALASAVAGGSAVAAGAVTSVGAAAYFARRVLTPDRQRPDDTRILAVDDHSVSLDVTPDTVVPGRYGLWLDSATGHARVGDVVELDEEGGCVRRELHGVDYGHLAPGFARWNQYYFAGPPDRALGLRTEYVDVLTELGTMPAWVVRTPSESRRWAILVHGRGARRDEALRAVRTFHDSGVNVLIPSYRNDIGARSGADGRYNLGLSEWRDIEDAALHAVQQGARELVLMGWSMGGAIVLQTLSRSWLAEHVTHVVLDAPVIDWGDVLAHHAREHRVPAPIGGLSRSLMGRRSARRLVGVHDPLDVAKTNWVARAAELSHRILLIHSVDDEFVPVGPSQQLAQARPDLVTMEHWDTARHTKEWNVDPARWERSVAEFLSS